VLPKLAPLFERADFILAPAVRVGAGFLSWLAQMELCLGLLIAGHLGQSISATRPRTG
jgi:hypothetical protein